MAITPGVSQPEPPVDAPADGDLVLRGKSRMPRGDELLDKTLTNIRSDAVKARNTHLDQHFSGSFHAPGSRRR